MRTLVDLLAQAALVRRWWARRVVNRVWLLVWRLGLWSIIDWVYLVLTTTGRRTGQPRHTVLAYTKLNGRIYLFALWPKESDWYLNVLADPRVTVQTARGTLSARATRVADDAELLALYRHFDPRLEPVIAWYLRSSGVAPDPAEILARKDELHVLRLDPTDEPTPAPLSADLTWIPTVVGIVGLGLWLLRTTRARSENRRGA